LERGRIHRSRTTGEEIEGSPLIAVSTEPSFEEYHFIDLDGQMAGGLRRRFAERNVLNFPIADMNATFFGGTPRALLSLTSNA
jgi:hypothetical protein